MANGQTSLKTSTVTLGYRDLYRLWDASSHLSTIIEDILEAKGAYKKSFVKGVREALHQVKKGKLKKIDSLRDLL